MQPNSQQSRSTLPRAAFSLVEILIVLAIMGILAGLAFTLLGQTGQIARDAATKSGIQFIQSALDDRIRGFENITQPMMLSDPDLPMKPELREFRKRVQEFYALYDASNTPPRSAMPSPSISPIWEVYVRKALFKAAFPQREEDLYGMDGVSDYETSPNTYVDDSPILSRMWDSAGSTWAADSWKGRDVAARATLPINVADDDQAESAELLYLILTSGDVFGLPPADLDGMDQGLIGDTDNDDNLELLDGWGKPLQFYNWPTRFFKANGTTYTATDYSNASILVSGLPAATAPTPQRALMNRDPGDNSKLLNGYFTANITLTSQPREAMPIGAAWFHDRNSYYVNLIVSAGPDGSYGMELPNSTTSAFSRLGLVTSAADLADNISNRQKGPQ